MGKSISYKCKKRKQNWSKLKTAKTGEKTFIRRVRMPKQLVCFVQLTMKTEF